MENTEIELPEFYSQFNTHLTQLQSQLAENISALEEVMEFIEPYISDEIERISKEGLAIISIVFNDRQTTTSLTEFAKALTAWKKILPVYHQLLKSKSPEDIQIIEVQNASIDLIINLNVDVALDLVELFKVGFGVFAAYLTYKRMMKGIIDMCHGNKKLINIEKKKEKILLDNIGEAVQGEINAQHKKAIKADKKINTTSIDKKVEQVAQLVTSHIVKGNDLKLLALPEPEEPEEGEEDLPDQKEALREKSMAARHQLRQIPTEDQQKLLEEYGKIDEESEEE
jgi:hypothetical protein